MKRRALALCAGFLLMGLMPGSTLAIVTPTYIDQSNTVKAANVSGHFAQTFTAGQSGPLSRVDLVLVSANAGGDSLSLSIYPTDGAGTPVTTGTALATSGVASVPCCAVTGAWVSFSFASPFSVTAGTMYAIVFDTHAGGANVWAFGSNTNAYSRGAAWRASPSWGHETSPDPDDFDFRTYLEDSITTTVAWDKSQLTPGTGTALKLTVTIVFGNGPEADNYLVLLGNLPSWYVNPTPPTIVCSWGPCTLATIQGVAGITVPASNPGATLTVTLQGTATPAVSDEGTPGVAHGNGCIVVSESSLCSDGTASVAVGVAGATPAPTLPPTSTSAGPASDNNDGMIWFLPFALAASIGGLLVLVIVRRRQIT
jgi:hypothetical protein